MSDAITQQIKDDIARLLDYTPYAIFYHNGIRIATVPLTPMLVRELRKKYKLTLKRTEGNHEYYEVTEIK